MARNLVVTAGVLLAAVGAAAAELQTASVFCDGMVLQRGRPVPVWGVAEPGATITLRFAGQCRTAQAGPHGAWRVDLDALDADPTGREMTIASSADGAAPATLTIANVVVGDVWLMIANPNGLGGRQSRYRGGGRSKLGNYYDNTPFVEADQAAGLCGYIRAYVAGSARGRWAARPQRRYGGPGRWQIFDPKRWGGYDGMSYYFARTLLRGYRTDERVPVGLLRCGADDLQALTPPAGFAAVAATAALARETRRWDPTCPAGRAAYEATLAEIRAWAARTGRLLDSDGPLPVTQPPRLPGPTPGVAAPTTAYNYLLCPLVPFAVRGILIKADFNNLADPQYTAKATGLIAGLRSVFGDPKLPVCWLQMRTPMYFERNAEPFADAWQQLRAAQAPLAALPGVDVVGTYDFVIDPRDPRNWGVRMARWARAVVAGQAVRCGPIYSGHRVEGSELIVRFDQVGDGLMVGRRRQGEPAVRDADGALATFELAGPDKTWHAARAVIRGKTVVVRSADVARPIAVRYADAPAPRGANLYNLAGFPALPFRTPLE